MTCEFRPSDIREDGYDPRGTGTDHYKCKCQKCGATMTFSVGYRDDYQRELTELEENAHRYCGLLSEVRKREISDKQKQIAKLQTEVNDLVS